MRITVGARHSAVVVWTVANLKLHLTRKRAFRPQKWDNVQIHPTFAKRCGSKHRLISLPIYFYHLFPFIYGIETSHYDLRGSASWLMFHGPRIRRIHTIFGTERPTSLDLPVV